MSFICGLTCVLAQLSFVSVIITCLFVLWHSLTVFFLILFFISCLIEFDCVDFANVSSPSFFFFVCVCAYAFSWENHTR